MATDGVRVAFLNLEGSESAAVLRSSVANMAGLSDELISDSKFTGRFPSALSLAELSEVSFCSLLEVQLHPSLWLGKYFAQPHMAAWISGWL